MVELDAPTLPADKARTLLRRLRDLNLVCGPVAITRDLGVIVSGCLTLDTPAEAGVGYRLRDLHGKEGRLDVLWSHDRLDLAVSGIATKRLSVRLSSDRMGRACAPTIGGRVRPETTSTLELEHFVRRVLRALLR